MDQAVTSVPALANASAPRAHASPRIYYIHPRLAGPLLGWERLLDHAKAMGFTHVLTAPIFSGPSVFLPADFDRAHPILSWDGDAAAALARFSADCRARDLIPLLDVVPDRVAAGQIIATEHPDLFRAPDIGWTLDPRAFGPEGDAAPARWDSAADELAGFWTERLRTWQAAGIAGFRLMLENVPPAALRRLADSVRDAGPTLLLGWTPGLSRDTVRGFRGAGLDYVFSSLPWWNFSDEWFWVEADTLRHVAPAIACVEAPFGPRLAAGFSDPSLLPAARRRILNFAAAFGDGFLVPMGFEAATTLPMDPRRDTPESFHGDPAIEDAIRTLARQHASGDARLLGGTGGDVLAIGCASKDLRYADDATVALINTDLDRRRAVALAPLLAAAGGRYVFAAASIDATVDLAPGDMRVLELVASPPIVLARPVLKSSAEAAARAGRIGIERVTPSVDDGRFAAKRLAGELVTVEADILCDGHDQLSAALFWREDGSESWQQTRMRLVANDRWAANFPLSRVGRYIFRIEAWRDAFGTFRDELRKKHAAGINVEVELIEGRHLVADAGPALAAISRDINGADIATQITTLLSPNVATLMAEADKRPRAVRSREYPIEADRLAAEFASWYEIFPRSMSDDPARHGTFRDVVRHLPRIRDMGFDVLYFPPIHPIGRVNRKGRNNTLTPAADDPGSPYAIGSTEGGHDAIHPELGTFEDFAFLRKEAAAHGLELALDFAIQCAPDHPWLKAHKGWFAWRPDGSMRYAENPPKKYEDIVNVDFYADAAIPDLWVALAETVMFWAERGVRIFRVDNPHTKPFPFWEWMFAEVRARFPDTLFLAEAFTRPKIMNRLGKIGFSQSYTYFTWRNSKRELQEYLTELTTTEARDFFRPNFFVNTPDINPIPLQTSGRSGFLIRASLAATLSGLWGVYCGFELCEATPLPGREEYADSEKYQIRAWDWDRPGNIVADIALLNRLRRENPALHTHLGLTFLSADSEAIMFYEKATPDRSNVILVAVSLDPERPQSANVELPLWRWGLPDGASLQCADLISGASFTWTGKWQRLTLDPSYPFAIWRARPLAA